MKKIIVVIGPGRSGTSVVTRGLQVLGVSLGNRLMPPKRGVNDKGFWEDQDIYALNRAIFKKIRHDWNLLRPVPALALRQPNLESLKSRAKEIVRCRLQSASTFGMKDPQITRLLPFWQEVFGSMGVQAGYVLACRNPMSVAQSLSRYTGLTLKRAYLIWFEFTLASLIHTKGLERVVVNYESLLRDSLGQLERIGSALGLKIDAMGRELHEYRHGFLDRELCHAEYGMADLRASNAVPRHVVALYELILSLASDPAVVAGGDAAARIAEPSRLSGIKPEQDRYLMDRRPGSRQGVKARSKETEYAAGGRDGIRHARCAD
ncbi:MAG: hypothetical protein M0Z84_02550 [Gammaproteobacteria bacterium]|nr:hypothetical protein [Gammaproteobacteria bacterium]